jgi:hypothetical protein
LAEFEPVLGEADKFAIAQKELRAKGPADPKTNIVPDHRGRGRARDDKGKIKLARRPGIGRGQNQNRFSGQWNTSTLEHYDEKDDPIAVLRDEGLNMGKKHGDSIPCGPAGPQARTSDTQLKLDRQARCPFPPVPVKLDQTDRSQRFTNRGKTAPAFHDFHQE